MAATVVSCVSQSDSARFDDSYGGLEVMLQERGGAVIVGDVSDVESLGGLQIGDSIIAIDSSGDGAKFVSVVGMSLTRVNRLIRGEVGAKIAIVYKRPNSDDFRIATLERGYFVSGRTAEGEQFVAKGIYRRNVPASDPAEFADFLIQPYEKWSLVNRGLGTNEVVRIIGKPISARNSDGDNLLDWYYGCRLDSFGQSFNLGLIRVRIRDGRVVEGFDLNRFENVNQKYFVLAK